MCSAEIFASYKTCAFSPKLTSFATQKISLFIVAEISKLEAQIKALPFKITFSPNLTLLAHIKRSPLIVSFSIVTLLPNKYTFPFIISSFNSTLSFRL